MPRRKILLLGVAGLLCVAALLAIAILLIGRFGQTEGRIMGTTLLLAGYGLLALPGVILLDQGRARLLADTAIGLTALAAGLALFSIWGISDSDPLGKSIASATILALAAAQAAALVARQKPTDPQLTHHLFTASCVTATITSSAAVVLIWTQAGEGIYGRLIAALLILDLLLVALQPISAALTRPPRAGPHHHAPA
jgi:hypothetical protein